MTCGKLVKAAALDIALPCLRDAHHMGAHTPDLTGMRFGNYTVIERADDLIDNKGYRRTQWRVRDKEDRLAVQGADTLLKGYAKGIRAKKGSGLGARLNGKKRPEYHTVMNHYKWITKPELTKYKSYHGIPFYDGWDVGKGGSILKGMNWILENLGPKPPNSHLHVVPVNRGGKGFGPWKADDGDWSIRWISPLENNMVENKKYVDHKSNEEFEKEANRRGFKLVRISEAAA